MDVPITITQRELLYMSPEKYHKMETGVTNIQPTYTAEQSNFTVEDTTNRSLSEEALILPDPIAEIFCNTHNPTEQPDPNTVEPIPTPPDSPINQLQSNVTDSETDYHISAAELRFIFLPNTTENNRRHYQQELTNYRQQVIKF